WSSLGDGMNHQIFSITKYKGNIVASGEFDSSGTRGFKMPIAKWSGIEWLPIDTNTALDNFTGTLPTIRSIVEYNNKLYIIGRFYHHGPFPGIFNFGDFAVWNDTVWNPAVRPTMLFVSQLFDLEKLTVYQNQLYLTGVVAYDSCAFNGLPGVDAESFCRYNEACLSVEKVGNFWGTTLIRSTHEYNGSLYLGHTSQFAQGNSITRFDGVNFYPVDDGFNSDVIGMTTYLGNLCAAGYFNADGLNNQQFPSRVAIYDGINWSSLPTSCNITGPTLLFAGSIDSTLIVSGLLDNCGALPLGFSATYPNSLTSIDEYKSEAFQIYPNPATGTIKINYTDSQPGTIDIYNIVGQKISHHFLVPNLSNEIDISFLNQGVYIAKVTDSHNRETLSKLLVR
ncbi:MAG TPA: T9SS type A sorting domain-containing protein, partial [Bacteroidia bacterium]|nr:T9SS type A sorting domain-containing protein [Bacteroidia bacterium]